MKTTLLLSAAIAAATALSGCATVTRGSTEDVVFTSNPPGVNMRTSLGPGCITPCTIKISRRDTFQAVFEHEDETRTVFVDTEVAGGGAAGVAGNVLLGGVIGVGVDVATGAGLDHVPNPVHADFTVPVEGTTATAEEPAETPNEETAAPAAVSEEPAQPSETDDAGFKWEEPPAEG